MIYTLTFNPSLDYTMELPELVPGGMNRAHRAGITPGGKGINVSMILDTLGMANTMLGFVAGFTGDEIERSLKASGHHSDFIRLKSGLSRINVKLCSDASYAAGTAPTELNAPGPAIDHDSLNALDAQLNRLSAGDVLVLSGSVPESLPVYTYQRILDSLKGRNVLTFVDTTGESLLSTLSCRPFLIKPNRQELEELFSTHIKLHNDVDRYAARLHELGARNVLISLDGEGAVLLCEDGRYIYLEAPSGQVVNPVCAGDSMLAGFIYGWLSTHDHMSAFRYAIAAGSASAFSSGLASKDDIMSLYRLQTK